MLIGHGHKLLAGLVGELVGGPLTSRNVVTLRLYCIPIEPKMDLSSHNAGQWRPELNYLYEKVTKSVRTCRCSIAFDPPSLMLVQCCCPQGLV
jgi:hypothetical protein